MLFSAPATRTQTGETTSRMPGRHPPQRRYRAGAITVLPLTSPGDRRLFVARGCRERQPWRDRAAHPSGMLQAGVDVASGWKPAAPAVFFAGAGQRQLAGSVHDSRVLQGRRPQQFFVVQVQGGSQQREKQAEKQEAAEVEAEPLNQKRPEPAAIA